MLRIPVILRGVVVREGRYVPEGVNGYLIADFGPQALAERAAAGPRSMTPPVGARLAGSSRLAFVIPPSGVPTTFAGLMDWSVLPASVSALGSYLDGVSIPNKVRPSNPSEVQTAIEMPWWLILSPHRMSAWAHAASPVTKGTRTELWHTRLAWHDLDVTPPLTRASEDRDFFDFDIFTVRAVWLRDPANTRGAMLTNPDAPNPAVGSEGRPFEMRPTPRQRANLVRLSSMKSVGGVAAFGGYAKAIPVRTLALSPLGGTLHVDATWNDPDVAPILSWQHRTWQGRDTFVRIVEKGYLYPWGVAAALNEEVVRVFAASDTGGIRAYQVLRSKVVVTEPTVDLTSDGAPFGGRGSPFDSVTCLTTSTPVLANATENGGDLFVPKVQTTANGATAPVQFEFVGIDKSGREVAFRMPVMFVRHQVNRRTAVVRTAYAALPLTSRQSDFGGQPVAFAAEVDDGRGQTSLPTGVVTFALDTPGDAEAARDAFVRMASASVNLEDLSRLTGLPTPTTVEFPDAYLSHAFDVAANQVQAYLMPTAERALQFGAKAAGGLLVPALTVAGLSRSLGPIPGAPGQLAQLCADAVVERDPAEAIDDAVRMFGDIKLLGGISLSDILGPAIDVAGRSGIRVTTDTVRPGRPDAVITTRMTWNPELEVVADTPASGLLDVSRATFEITVTSVLSLVDGSSSWSSVGRLRNLGVVLLKDSTFIAINFERLTFTAGSDTDTDLDAAIGDVQFLGLMSMLKDLSQYLVGEGNELSLNVSGAGLSATLGVFLPQIGLGAFTLTGVGARLGIDLPFDARPVRTRVGFSTPDNPFGVTVLGLGGCGWVGSSVGLDGVEKLEVAVAIQAAVVLDFGVASGTVRVMLGYCIGLESNEDDDWILSLIAFVKIMGRVDVLGLIEVSIEVYIGLGAIVPQLGSGERVALVGEARVSVKIKILFCSKRVSWAVRRELKGPVVPDVPEFVRDALEVADVGILSPVSRGRQQRSDEETVTFADAMSESDWTTWCGAFA